MLGCKLISALAGVLRDQPQLAEVLGVEADFDIECAKGRDVLLGEPPGEMFDGLGNLGFWIFAGGCGASVWLHRPFDRSGSASG